MIRLSRNAAARSGDGTSHSNIEIDSQKPPPRSRGSRPDRPHLDLAHAGPRMPRRDLEGLVEIDALDQAEAADLVLRLGERTVRQQDLVRAQLDRGRVVGGTEAESATQHAAPGHLRAPVVA